MKRSQAVMLIGHALILMAVLAILMTALTTWAHAETQDPILAKANQRYYQRANEAQTVTLTPMSFITVGVLPPPDQMPVVLAQTGTPTWPNFMDQAGILRFRTSQYRGCPSDVSVLTVMNLVSARLEYRAVGDIAWVQGEVKPLLISTGNEASSFSFLPPVSGVYEARVIVIDADGLESCARYSSTAVAEWQLGGPSILDPPAPAVLWWQAP